MLYYNKKKSQKKHYIRTLVLAAIIIVSSLSPKASDLTSKVVSLITRPFAVVTSLVSDAVGLGVDSLVGSKPNRDMVERLTQENQELTKKLNDLNFIIDQEEALKAAASLQESLETTPAHVIMLNNQEYFNEMIIDKGSNQNVEVGDIILNSYTNKEDNVAGALVGIVTNVDLNTSSVSTILDEKYNISFIHSKSGISGIINERNGLDMDGYLLEKTDVNLEDSVYTSGLGGRFPRGIYIGKVKSVGETADRLSQTLSVESPVEFSKLYHVFIVKPENQVREEVNQWKNRN